ncbi:hypothetical protein JT366_08505 [Sphingomonas paucimobilis]|uniref:hypothetical protein n=1 Tax=Sphingomonas paucimobilis TaxID=13689 RepID=UPI001964B62E|nr:hypothetical protein [Sphingomonas paucimobilis]QRY97245.1 hypothetical protein JT366_08505 [Sphingomonas paucimobilis]
MPAGINRKYDLLAQKAREAAASNDRLTASLTNTLKANEKARQAELEEERKRQRDANRKPEKVSLGDQLQREQSANLLAYAQRYTGRSENNAGDRNVLNDLFKQANVAIDPKITAWCAAFVNSVLAANGLQGTVTAKGAADLSARSFLNYGQSTDDPNKGDIVVSRRGKNEAQGHVGFYQARTPREHPGPGRQHQRQGRHLDDRAQGRAGLPSRAHGGRGVQGCRKERAGCAEGFPERPRTGHLPVSARDRRGEEICRRAGADRQAGQVLRP